jgi:ribosome biogenesis GTPase A
LSHIQWYPGHIAKAQRDLKEKLNLIDVIVEVLDARLPISSAYKDIQTLCSQKPRLIVLNKIDLADDTMLLEWQKFIKKESGCPVLLMSANDSKASNKIINKILELSRPMVLELLKKQMLPRPVRVMVVGLPNVGKSSIINRLIKKAKTKTGAKAGVTRQQQWVRVHPKIDLLDTPGIIPMALKDQDMALKLAYVNSVGEKAYDSEYVAGELLKLLQKNYEKTLREYYNIGKDDITIENIALSRNWIVQGAKPDITRTCDFILLNFRDGKIGKITLDEMPV